jgi:hypothetical protein
MRMHSEESSIGLGLNVASGAILPLEGTLVTDAPRPSGLSS